MSNKLNKLAQSLLEDKRYIISRKKRKPIKTKSVKLQQSFRTSFIVALLFRIIFFPFFAIRWYIQLAKINIHKFIIFNILGVVLLCGYIFICYMTLPDVKQLTEYKPILSSKFYDRNGEMIFETSNEKRTYVKINEVPKKLIQAFIAAEDKTFYTNPGFDIYGLIRTGFQDIYKFIRGQKLHGASTITQQVVKNVLLSNERSLTRKIKELILASRVAKTLPKDKVMEIYLNHIYLGMQSYGVVVASEEYFGKTLAQLSIPEMAMLAALPKAPSAINPFRSYNRAIQRRNWVLLRMFEDGYITQDEYEEYKNTELIVHKKVNQWAPFYAPSFFAQSLIGSEQVGITKDNILNDGYNVFLTIDGSLQRMAQDALNHTIENYTKNHGFTGALFTYDADEVKNKTPSELLRAVDEPENIGHKVLAVVLSVQDNETIIGLQDNTEGKITFTDMSWARPKISETQVSYKSLKKCQDILRVGDVIVVKQKNSNSEYYTLEQIPTINGGVLAMNPQTGEILAMVGGYLDQAGAFNRTTQAFRQVGSTIKPFVYATALERGFTPTSIFMDAPLSINIGNGLTWDPENHNKVSNGPMTLRMGLEKSKNTVTVRIADAIGMKQIRQTLINAGINDHPESNLSVALGSVESSLVKMARAYSMFANGGKLPAIRLIDRVDKVDNQHSTTMFGSIYFSNCNHNNQCDITIGEAKMNDDNITATQAVDLTGEEENNDVNTQNAEGQQGERAYNMTDNASALQDENNIQYNTESKTGTAHKEKDETNVNESKQVISAPSAYQIANILQGAVKRGTSSRLSALGLPIASKTGTSDGGRDMWNVVVSPSLVIVVYVGFDQPLDTNNYGAQYALPVVQEILSKWMVKHRFNDFASPGGIKFVKINRLTGTSTTADVGGDVIFEAFKEHDEVVSADSSNSGSDGDGNIDITEI